MNDVHFVNVVHETPRERRREESATRILDTAQRLVADDGLEALTMQRLATELGYTVGATYRYFASKDELLAALQRRVFVALGDDLRAAIERLEARHPRPGKLAALSRVAVVARVYATLADRRPTDARLLGLMLADPRNVLDGEHGAANVATAIELGAIAASALAGAAREGALADGDAAQRALVLWAALQGVAQTKKLERWGVPGLSGDALADETVRALLVGWGAEAARVREARARASEIL